jgi:hypothetical protein
LREPLKIDVLIIKKKKNVVIKKNIGQNFQMYNVVEYKSPGASVSIEAYHKTHCYARLYAVLNKVSIDEMSVTVVATRHPRKLLAFLRDRFSVTHTQPGIYLVAGDTCPAQIIVSEELSEADNFWLTNLRNDLTDERLERVYTTAKGRPSIGAYIDAITSANTEALEELQMRKKRRLHELLEEWCGDEWRAKGIAIGEARGEARGRAVTLLNILRARFNRVPKETERTILAMSDPIALDSWAVHAATCQSMDEFISALR